jgi:hypothetical protein
MLPGLLGFRSTPTSGASRTVRGFSQADTTTAQRFGNTGLRATADFLASNHMRTGLVRLRTESLIPPHGY